MVTNRMLPAIFTDADERSCVSLDLTAEIFLCSFHDVIDVFHFQIEHIVAAAADEMIMGLGIVVETFCAVSGVDAVDLAKLGKQTEIAVDGSETDIWIDLPEILINSICCGMVLAPGEKMFDRFSLAAVFYICHISSKTIIIPVLIIRKDFPNVNGNKRRGVHKNGGVCYHKNSQRKGGLSWGS